MKKYGIEKILEIGSKLSRNVRYLDYESYFFSLGLDDGKIAKNLLPLDLEAAAEYLENTNVVTGIYSTYFNDFFEDPEIYEQAVRNNDRIINIVKYDKLTEIAAIITPEGNAIDLVDGLFDAEIPAERMRQAIERQKEEIQSAINLIDFYESTMEDLAAEDFESFEDLARAIWEIERNEGADILRLLRMATQEQGCDDYMGQLYDITREKAEIWEKQEQAKEMAEMLSKELTAKAEIKQAKKIKI